MLEGIAVVLGIIIELIGVSEEIAPGAERITAADIRAGQSDALGLVDEEDRLGIAVKRLTDLIPDIGVGVLIRDDLHGILHARGTMIGGEHEGKP